MTHADLDRLEAQTDEGAQELRTRSRSREVVLTGGGMWPEDELGDDTPAEVEKILGKAWLDRLMRNGSVLLKATSKVEA